MRIQSKFVDYYDCQQKYADYDAKPFIRNIYKGIANSNLKQKNVIGHHYSNIYIGFCGTIYPCVKKHSYTSSEKDLYYYNSDFFIKKITSKRDKEFKRRLDGYFTQTKDDSIFLEYNCPIFILYPTYRDNNFVIYAHTMGRSNNNEDSSLSKLSFQDIIPANIAYMNIESYIHDVLFRENKIIPEPSDIDKLALNGFDNNSFKHLKRT